LYKKVRAEWYGRYDPKRDNVPDPRNVKKLQEFLEKVYKEKQFYVPRSDTHVVSSDSDEDDKQPRKDKAKNDNHGFGSFSIASIGNPAPTAASP
jgi:hypothetical protein